MLRLKQSRRVFAASWRRTEAISKAIYISAKTGTPLTQIGQDMEITGLERDVAELQIAYHFGLLPADVRRLSVGEQAKMLGYIDAVNRLKNG